MFDGKVAVVTGGANGIGKCIAGEFRKCGAQVAVIDKAPGEHFVGDIADKSVLESFTEYVIERYGHIDYLVNNALPFMRGIDECSYEEFQYALSVGVTAPFYLAKLFAPYFGQGGSIVNISSSRDRMSQPQTESYTAAKGGIAALTHALAVSLAGTIPFLPDGSIPPLKAGRARMPSSSRFNGWAIRSISPIWCFSSVRTKQGSLPGRISASTAG